MGIPLLRKRFEQYSQWTVLGCSTPNCQQHSKQARARTNRVIIDGPCLAYFIYRRLVSHKPGELGPIDGQPSYGELGDAVVAFLAALEECRMVV